MQNNFKVILSNGIHRFHLSAAAAEISKRGRLDIFLTAGYPGKLSKLLSGYKILKSNNAWLRLLDREESQLNSARIRAYWSVEWMVVICVAAGKLFKSPNLKSWLESFVFQWYGFIAGLTLLGRNADVYHYRAGFGGLSVRVARAHGMKCICDHSAVHPALFDFMTKNAGKLPSNDNLKISRFWKIVLNDINNSDCVIVNSDFVKETMTYLGCPEDKISVIYLGVDDKFYSSVPKKNKVNYSSPVMLYAGRVTKEKGFDILLNAVHGISGEWKLIVAGGVDDDLASQVNKAKTNKRIVFSGFISRDQLAKELHQADIFVFPSLAEGSARVVFEAMACCCYIITTPNSGSIVQDGIHGNLVSPGDVEELRESIAKALEDIQRTRTIGDKNGKLILESYTQHSYGNELMNVYKRLLAGNENA